MMNKPTKVVTSFYIVFLLHSSLTINAQDSAAEMAKKLQDPLANITAIMSDNDLMFKTGQDDFSYSTSLQRVKAWSFDKAGFNLVGRGVIPILGMVPEAQNQILESLCLQEIKPPGVLVICLHSFSFRPKRKT